MPQEIEAKFTSQVTPNPASQFSPLVFARSVDVNTYEPIESGTVFLNPVRRIVAIYSYDSMSPGVQWTALWYRDGKLIYFDTAPWDGTTGGYGSAERVASPDEWLSGNYEVQIFIGLEWKTVGRFVIEGDAPTSTATRVPSPTVTDTATVAPRPSATASNTLLPTSTLAPTRTRRPTDTPWPSQTPKVTP